MTPEQSQQIQNARDALAQTLASIWEIMAVYDAPAAPTYASLILLYRDTPGPSPEDPLFYARTFEMFAVANLLSTLIRSTILSNPDVSMSDLLRASNLVVLLAAQVTTLSNLIRNS